MKKIKKLNSLWHGLTSVFAVLSVGVFTGYTIANNYQTVADQLFAPLVSSQASGEEAKTYESPYENTTDFITDRDNTLKQIAAEGTVLLKNNGALPLTNANNITLLGTASHYPLYGGNIASYVADKAEKISLESALSNYYSLNQTAIDYYKSAGNTRSASPDFERYNTGEVSLNSSVTSSFSSYGDAAICVIARASAEEADYSKDTVVTDADGHEGPKGMALSVNEKAMLDEAIKSFDKVIIVLNTASPIEIDEYANNENVDAILWCGYPGSLGFESVAKIIHGDINPSGQLSDTYAVNAANSAAAQNYGNYLFSNYTTAISSEYQKYADAYLIQAEGIYTGYKYYETRYYDSVNDPEGTNAKVNKGVTSGSTWNYNDEVTYSFGYGLSYTTFSEEFVADKEGTATDTPILTYNSEDKTYTTYVKVTNTGDVAGKHAVQLYMQSPYTENDKRDGVEKSAVLLVDFEKTSELAPDASEVLELTFEGQYLASYNSSIVYDDLRGAYILDIGDYYFALGNGAHDALNNILAYQGKTASDGMDYVNNDFQNKVISQEIAIDSGDGYDYTYVNSKNGTRVSNQFENADYNYFKKNAVTYLTRSDWNTFPEEYDSGIEITPDMADILENKFYTVKTGEDTSEYQWGNDKGIKISELVGLDFNDPKWKEFILQMDFADALTIILKYNNTNDLTSFGINKWGVYDGPIGMYTTLGANFNMNEDSKYYVEANDPNNGYSFANMPCAPVVAATFNKELANKEGQMFGNDSLWSGYSTQFGPGNNLHRTPYGGRNHEYYSEDSMLANLICSEVTSGMKEFGNVAILKHFAFNDIENNRQGIAEFLTEQQIRENELRAFQGPCENNYAGGVMNSYSRMGLYSGAANEALNTIVLRQEWGFTGLDMTDAAYAMYQPYLDWITSMSTGGTSMLATSALWRTADVAKQISGDLKLMERAYDSIHYTLYTYANSNQVTGATFKIVRYWPGLLIGLGSAFAVLAVGGLVLTILSSDIGKKPSEKEEA